jgi:hypothetical protein
MNAGILLHEEDVGVLNALSHIKFFVSFVCSGIRSITFVFILYFPLCILQQQVTAAMFMQRYLCCPIVYTAC